MRVCRTMAIPAVLLTAAVTAVSGAASDPLAWLTTMGMVDASDRSTVEAGGVAITVLPARGRDLAVLGITSTHAAGARVAAWARTPEQLYKGRYVPAIGRFSDPPQLDDLATLALDDEDVNDLRKCRVAACDLKLSAPEILRMRDAITAAGPQWKTAAQDAFRDIVLARAEAYLAAGLGGLAPYHDRKKPVSPAEEYADIEAHVGFEALFGPRVLPHFRLYPGTDGEGVESFLYWSKETIGGAKPIVSITHMSIFRSLQPDGPGTLIAARQVFASHYLTGSLSITAITGGVGNTPNYLVYIRRSRTDAFDGRFGRLIRHMVEGRIRSDAPAVLDALRRKIEGRDPPGSDSTR